jgi:hypothetical protein
MLYEIYGKRLGRTAENYNATATATATAYKYCA